MSHRVKTKPVLGNAVPVLGVKPKRGWYVFRLVFEIGVCSAISSESFRRELSIDVAEHRTIVKNFQIKHYPPFSFTPETGKAFPKTRFCFYCSPMTSLLETRGLL